MSILSKSKENFHKLTS